MSQLHSLSRHLRQDPNLLAGEPLILENRHSLRAIISAWKRGDSPEQIQHNYPRLTLAQIYDAIGYHLDAPELLEVYTTPNLALIQSQPGVCGGQPRIRNTRITVWTIVALMQQGATDSELLTSYPNLTVEDLRAAWGYYEVQPIVGDAEIMSLDEE